MTNLEGYPIDYYEITDVLNEAMNTLRKADSIDIKNSLLEKIGSSISSFSRHIIHPTTSNGQTWFGALEYIIDKTKIAILFPWAQDWENPISGADSSIGIYSTKRISYKKITGLLKKIARQIEKSYKNNSLIHSSY